MRMKLSLDVSQLNRNENKIVIVVHSVMLTCIVLGGNYQKHHVLGGNYVRMLLHVKLSFHLYVCSE